MATAELQAAGAGEGNPFQEESDFQAFLQRELVPGGGEEVPPWEFPSAPAGIHPHVTVTVTGGSVRRALCPRALDPGTPAEATEQHLPARRPRGNTPEADRVMRPPPVTAHRGTFCKALAGFQGY